MVVASVLVVLVFSFCSLVVLTRLPRRVQERRRASRRGPPHGGCLREDRRAAQRDQRPDTLELGSLVGPVRSGFLLGPLSIQAKQLEKKEMVLKNPFGPEILVESYISDCGEKRTCGCL